MSSNTRRFDKTRLARVIARRLQISEDQKRTYYVLLFDAGNDDDNAVWERRAGLVRTDFPSLVFIRLTNDGIEYETELLDPFCTLLAESKEIAP